MKLIIGGIKGGTGKTTLATNLACLRASLKKRVLLVDADEQRSATDWADQRVIYADNNPLPVITTISLLGRNINTQINNMLGNYDDVIIDTGGRDTISQRSALTIADAYLIPFKPRSFDVWTIGHVKTLISEILSVNQNMKVFVAINQADPKGRDNEDAFQILSDVLDLKCKTCSIGHRKAFANAATDGLGVVEQAKLDKKAVEEILEIHHRIYG